MSDCPHTFDYRRGAIPACPCCGERNRELAEPSGSALPFGFRHLQCTNCHTTLAAPDTLELGNMRWCEKCQCRTEWTYAPNEKLCDPAP